MRDDVIGEGHKHGIVKCWLSALEFVNEIYHV